MNVSLTMSFVRAYMKKKPILLKEYWLIDLYQQEAFFWKNVAGAWQDLPVDARGVFRSEIIPGFWLRVDWLFAAEPLDEAAIFEMILAGDPETK